MHSEILAKDYIWKVILIPADSFHIENVLLAVTGRIQHIELLRHWTIKRDNDKDRKLDIEAD